VRPVTKLVPDVLREELAVNVVPGIDRALWMGPVGVLPQGVKDLVAELPVKLEEVPRPVNGERAQEVPGALVDGLLELLERHHPLRRALEDDQFTDLISDGGDNLHRTGAVADHRDPLAAEVKVPGPCG